MAHRAGLTCADEFKKDALIIRQGDRAKHRPYTPSAEKPEEIKDGWDSSDDVVNETFIAAHSDVQSHSAVPSGPGAFARDSRPCIIVVDGGTFSLPALLIVDSGVRGIRAYRSAR